MYYPEQLTHGAVRQRSVVSTLREPAFAVMARLDGVNPADQISAGFLACVAMAQAVGLDPHEEVARSIRMMEHADAAHTVHIAAIKDYARNEITRR